MKNSFLGLRTAIYHVEDLAAAKKWYTEAFEQEPYFDEPFYVGFSIKGYELGLLPSTDKQEKGTSVVAYWGVTDIEKTIKRLISLGAQKHEEPMDVGEGVMVATVKDPWNNNIGLIYNPFFKAEE